MAVTRNRIIKPVVKKNSLIKKGDEASKEIKKLNEERVKEKQRIEAQGGYVNNFFIPKPEKGEPQIIAKTFIVLDESNKELPSVNIHEWWSPSERKFHRELCVAQINEDSCPVCDYLQRKGEKYTRPSYNTYITIFETTTYINKEGKQVVGGKKLLQIKPQQREAFMEIFEAAMKKHKTIRGLKLKLKKDFTKTQQPSIGALAPIDGQVLWKMVKMSEIAAKYGNEPEIEKGKVIVEKNSNLKVYNYEKVFSEPDIDELSERYGAGVKEDFSSEDEEIDEDSINDYAEVDEEESEDTETEESEDTDDLEDSEEETEDEEESDDTEDLADELDELSNEDDE
jgi:hypothetical protein